MSNRSQGAVTFAPVGPTIDNGYEMGGSRIYPWSMGLAIHPSAYYSDFIGPGTGLPVAVPAGGLPDTIGASTVPSTGAAVAEAAAHPWGRTSPLPWIIGGLIFAVMVLHVTHYRKRGE